MLVNYRYRALSADAGREIGAGPMGWREPKFGRDRASSAEGE